MSTQRSVGIWSHVIRECHSTESWLTANSAELCFFGHKHYLPWALYSLFEYRRRKSLFCHKSRNPSDLHCLSTVCPSPAMFPQHSYKTLLRVSAVMRKKVDPASYGWSGRICHCSSPTDWISIKHLHMKKKIWLWLREWLKCILDTHRTPCDALLPLAHADAFFQGGAFFEHHIPAAVGIPGPHTGTERERERERERTDAHRDTKVYGNINQLRGDKRRAEVKRSCNDKSNFPLWKHTVH